MYVCIYMYRYLIDFLFQPCVSILIPPSPFLIFAHSTPNRKLSCNSSLFFLVPHVSQYITLRLLPNKNTHSGRRNP